MGHRGGRSLGRGGHGEVRGGRIKPAKSATEAWIEIGTESVVVGRDPGCKVVLEDGTCSPLHAELVATEHGVRVGDLGGGHGTFVGGVRVGEAFLVTATKLRMGETELAFEPARSEPIPVSSVSSFGPLVAQSHCMRSIFDRLTALAPTDRSLLITGETGVGKTLVARTLHLRSARANKPFVVVDCRSIPAGLAEATLFGHERGAVTGAVDGRASPFHEADGGTIFLDDVGELPIELQSKLLSALAERRIKPVGGSTYRDVDVRVVAATRRDLARAVNVGGFRSDLYFRIADVKIELPALRQRVEDIPGLVRNILNDLGDEVAYARVSAPTLERLMRHDWPGNVRELRNAVVVAHALEGEELDVAAHLGSLDEAAPHGSVFAGGGGGTGAVKGKQFQDAKREVLARFERDYFAALSDDAKGNVSEMARRAGMERAHVRAYLRRHGINGKGTDPEPVE